MPPSSLHYASSGLILSSTLAELEVDPFTFPYSSSLILRSILRKSIGMSEFGDWLLDADPLE